MFSESDLALMKFAAGPLGIFPTHLRLTLWTRSAHTIAKARSHTAAMFVHKTVQQRPWRQPRSYTIATQVAWATLAHYR